MEQLLTQQREFFATHTTKSLSFRMTQLKKLKGMLESNEAAILAALHQDLGKSAFEAYATEIGTVMEELNYFLKHLPKLYKDKNVRTPLKHFHAKSFIHSEPYGNVLVMSPWNYPFYLTLAPVVGAVAAGNTVVIKPSQYSPATSKLIADLIAKHFEPGFLTVVEGGREANTALLDQAFDYIFFTGSVNVGKIVMEKASKHLTPVTLELGGKSPCIVDKSANIKLAAKRIVWGKFLNAGQTCVAPDYVLVDKVVHLQLVDELHHAIADFWGNAPLQHPDYPKIINQKHFERLVSLTEVEADSETLKIAPTIADNISWDHLLMADEIFGPILPIIEYSDLDAQIADLHRKPKPLALYLFTEDKAVEDKVITRLSYGGGCVNDTIVHLATPYMPFGGVGQAGMGGYHGKWSFETFSHQKSILKKSTWLDMPLRYPPFKDTYLKLLKKL
jgi:aldehyde dehydrogenase (NAD+)